VVQGEKPPDIVLKEKERAYFIRKWVWFLL